MPNWTRNWITFSGPKEELDKIKDLMGDDFDFNKVIPMPETLDIESGSNTNPAIIAYIASLNGGLEHVEESKEAMRFLRTITMFDFNIDALDARIEKAIRSSFPVKQEDFPEEAVAEVQKAVHNLFEPLITLLQENSHLKKDIDRLRKLWPTMEDAKKEEMLKNGQTYVENIHKYGHSTWYDWRCDHWGTKWPACDVIMEEGADKNGVPTLSFEFDTAWSAPFPVIEKLESKFSDVPYEAWYVNEDDWTHSYGIRYEPPEWDDDDDEEEEE